MRHLAAVLPLTLLIASGSATPGEPDGKEWVPLFNGRDLEGWVPKITGYEVGDNFGRTFRVEDGVLKVAYDGYPSFDRRFGHLFHRRKLSHYVLAVEYRFTGEQVPGAPAWALRNSGVMFHSQPPESMRREQDFPISVEVQFLGGTGSGERPTANLCTPGTHVVMNGALVTEHCVSSASPTFHGEEWVRVELEVHGDSLVQHRVNGQPVLTYEKPQIGGGNVSGHDEAVKRDGKALTEGHLALQSESHPIEFRKVEVLDLVGCQDPKALNYRPYFVKADPAACRYP